MPLLYSFDIDSANDLLKILEQNLRKRRLEKGLSRNTLSETSGISTATIAKFEQKRLLYFISIVEIPEVVAYLSRRQMVVNSGLRLDSKS